MKRYLLIQDGREIGHCWTDDPARIPFSDDVHAIEAETGEVMETAPPLPLITFVQDDQNPNTPAEVSEPPAQVVDQFAE